MKIKGAFNHHHNAEQFEYLLWVYGQYKSIHYFNAAIDFNVCRRQIHTQLTLKQLKC